MIQSRRLASILFILVPPLAAQTAPATPPPPGSDDDTVKMEKFEVSDVPIELNVIPTSRPINSIYGMDRSLLDTPRSATIISREQLTAISIQDVRDFSKLTASSYTRSNFGAPSTPDLRGQIADLFQNGMRVGLSSNGNGLPINFNAVESVAILKGPATAVYGASQYVGGYADLIMKRPSFDSRKGSVSFTAGSYDVYRWNADYNVPVNARTAYRISYSGEQSKGYYEDGKKNTQALYVALTHRHDERYDLFANAEFFLADYTENFGINRPTQELIDRGLYQTGINNNPAPDFSGGAFLGYRDSTGAPITFSNINVVAGTPAAPSDAQNSRWVVSGFPAVNRIVLGPKVAIDRKKRLLRPGDDSEGVSFNAQVVQTLKVSPDFEIGNNTFFRYVNRNTLSSYSYSEIIDPSFSFENRTELRRKAGRLSYNTGVSFRYQQVKAYNDFFNEPANVWDLTRDLRFVNYFNSVNSPNPFTQVPVPGWQGRYYTPDNGDSGVSQATYFSPFFQGDWVLGDRFSILGGARLDLLSISYSDPAGFLPGDKVTVGLPNYNISPSFKLTPALSVYLTYNWSQNPVGSTGNGGSLTTAGLPTFAIRNLRNESELLEAGIKYAAPNGKVFGSLTFFDQVRADVQLDRSVVELTGRGIELEGNWQPSRNFYLTAGYSYTDAKVNTGQFDVGNTSLTPPTDRFFILPSGREYRRQGVPRNLFNALATWKFEGGFGITAGGVWTSDINNNVVGTIVIPHQYSVDVTAFYSGKNYDLRLAVLNATDEENWSAPNQVYGNESIVAELPLRVEATIKYRF
jgi:catecholate siderophore receptor